MPNGSRKNIRGNAAGKGLLRALGGRGGKLAGFAAIAAPIAGFVISDLKSHNSIIRGMANAFIDGYRETKASMYERSDPVDITDQVEIVDID